MIIIYKTVKIIYKTVKPMNVRSRLLSQNKKKQITNINMKTLKLLIKKLSESSLVKDQRYATNQQSNKGYLLLLLLLFFFLLLLNAIQNSLGCSDVTVARQLEC